MIQSLIISYLFTSSLVFASTETLRWKECVREVEQNNPRLRSATESLQSAREQTKGAFSPFLPQVSGSAGYSHGGTETTVGSTTVNKQSTSYSTALNASQNLFSGFQDAAQLKDARARELAAGYDLDIVRAGVCYDLKTAYEEMIFSIKNEKLNTEIIRRREDNLKLVRLRFESGRENKGSLSLSQAYLSDSKLNGLQSTHAVDRARTELLKILGRDTDTPVEVAEAPPLSDPPAVPDFRKLALNNINTRKALSQEDRALAQMDVSRSGFFPSLNLNASIGDQGEHWYPQDRRWSVGATLTIPLFNGGRDYYSLKSSMASLRAAQFDLLQSRSQLISQLKDSYYSFLEANEKLKVDREFLDAARLRSEIARSKYNNGLLSFDDWDQIENTLISKQTAYLLSEKARLAAEANWQKLNVQGCQP